VAAEHQDRNVILLTLALPSRSLTWAVSHLHLIAEAYAEAMPRKSGLRPALSYSSKGSVLVLRDGSELA
jgi:hypothetical protein